jgi:signal transduction histidine kinase
VESFRQQLAKKASLFVGPTMVAGFWVLDATDGKHLLASVLILLAGLTIGAFFITSNKINFQTENPVAPNLLRSLVLLLLVYLVHEIGIKANINAIHVFYVCPIFVLLAFGCGEGLIWIIVLNGSMVSLLFLLNPEMPASETFQELRMKYLVAFSLTITFFFLMRYLFDRDEGGARRELDRLEARFLERIEDLGRKTDKLMSEISGLKRAEEELKGARITAESANRAKSEFLASMSHELRTCLNHVIGFTELLLDKHVGRLSEVQEEYLGYVFAGSKHLLSLINDILDLSKVEAGKLKLEPSGIDLRVLLKSSLALVTDRAATHGIQLSMDIDDLPDLVVADERKLKQIMYNVLSNAAKFTPDGGEVRVSARTLNSHGQQAPSMIDGSKCTVEISVSDTGIGLKQDDLERVFQPFEQVDGEIGRRYQGTGLGLSLAKKLVELHGGRMWAESEGTGLGSRFVFTIPLLS